MNELNAGARIPMASPGGNLRRLPADEELLAIARAIPLSSGELIAAPILTPCQALTLLERCAPKCGVRALRIEISESGRIVAVVAKEQTQASRGISLATHRPISPQSLSEDQTQHVEERWEMWALAAQASRRSGEQKTPAPSMSQIQDSNQPNGGKQ